ncbi:hypothetical protein JW960_28420 [candidate division KSB1 bacterium]|nr:hypothetical protein [candidate division KSB1 bacterium]
MGDHIVLIGSIMIGAMLLVSIVAFNSGLAFRGFDQTTDTMLHGELRLVSEVMLNDFRKIGFQVIPPSDGLKAISDTSIQFEGDIDGDGVPETVDYYLGNESSSPQTLNPYDRALYRRIDGGTEMTLSPGVTKFILTYFDGGGYETADPISVDCIDIQLDIASPSNHVDDKAYVFKNDSLRYYTCSWRTKVTPPNLLIE